MLNDLIINYLRKLYPKKIDNKILDKYDKWNNCQDRNIIIFSDPRYPALLKEITNPPKILFIEGDLSILQYPKIAIVGSRTASIEGLKIAKKFAYELSEQGFVITSGLALGIDTKAHEGALQNSNYNYNVGEQQQEQQNKLQQEYNICKQQQEQQNKLQQEYNICKQQQEQQNKLQQEYNVYRQQQKQNNITKLNKHKKGLTIAVLGTGIDIIYPKSNFKLAEKIKKNGLLISEFPLGESPLKQNFPIRNRIISGLSLGVVVVEAKIKSGSIITARLAMEQNREVFATPSSIFNFRARGSHEIIRQGAKLIETVDHILEELVGFKDLLNSFDHDKNFFSENKGSFGFCKGSYGNKLAELDKNSLNLLKNIGYSSISFDKLKEVLNFAADDLSAILIKLELEGLIAFTEGGYRLIE